MTREELAYKVQHINNLITLKDFCDNNRIFTLTNKMEQSLDYAISSIKTDLKYDLIYEGEDEVESTIKDNLEVNDVLDKVRAEIKQEQRVLENYPSKDNQVYCEINACKRHIEIIDKYRGEDND